MEPLNTREQKIVDATREQIAGFADIFEGRVVGTSRLSAAQKGIKVRLGGNLLILVR